MSILDFFLQQIPGVIFSGLPSGAGDRITSTSASTAGWSPDIDSPNVYVTDAGPALPRPRRASIVGGTNTVTLTALAHAALAGAQRGVSWAFAASNATPGSNVGAERGGGFTFTCGDAARNTSGNSAGGFWKVALGSPVGTGAKGRWSVTKPGGVDEIVAADADGFYAQSPIYAGPDATSPRVFLSSEFTYSKTTALTPAGASADVFGFTVAANTSYEGEVRILMRDSSGDSFCAVGRLLVSGDGSGNARAALMDLGGYDDYSSRDETIGAGGGQAFIASLSTVAYILGAPFGKTATAECTFRGIKTT